MALRMCPGRCYRAQSLGYGSRICCIASNVRQGPWLHMATDRKQTQDERQRHSHGGNREVIERNSYGLGLLPVAIAGVLVQL